MKTFIAICALASFGCANRFGLDFGSEEDNSYGHHGKPANYKAMDGIVHPWKAGNNKVVMNPMEELLADLFGEKDTTELFDWEGMMDPFGERKPKFVEDEMLESKKSSEMDDDMAMITIMESTPEMCPLCEKEGHALGHDAHKKFLSKLREKLILDSNKKKQQPDNKNNKKEKTVKAKEIHANSEEELMTLLTCEICRAEGHVHNHKEHKEMEACPFCKAEGTVKNHEEHMCPLCRAEGSMKNHEEHKILMKLADDLEIPKKAKKSEEKTFGCRLCQSEGSNLNHAKHVELAAALKRKLSMEQLAPIDLLRQQESYRSGLQRILGIIEEHRDLMVASLAESQLARDRRQRAPRMDLIEPSLSFEFIFDGASNMAMIDDGFWMDSPEMMMNMKREDPIRDFHRRVGEPADDEDDKEDGDKESLWDNIIRNIRDLLGLGDESTMKTASNDDSDDDISEFASILIMILVLFVGLLLVSFGLVELLSAIFGENDNNGYESVNYDAEERMILDMEDGVLVMSKKNGGSSKGAISI